MSGESRVAAGRGEPFEISFDDVPITCYPGETVSTAILASGHEFGRTRTGAPRKPLCNMGTCYDCAVSVDGVPLVRACLTDARPGMHVESTEAG